MSEHRYDIRISESCVDPNPLMAERQDPDNFTRFQTRKRCALEIAAYVLKTTKRDQAMMSTELDDCIGRLCVLVCVDTFIITIFILTRGVSCLFEQFEITITHLFKK